jgi:hypothetical protein
MVEPAGANLSDALLKLKEERKEKSAHRRSVDVARATHPLMAA